MSSREFPNVPISIVTPSDLVWLIDQVKRLVDAGHLRALDEVGEFGETTKLADLNSEGPWPDLVSMRFCSPDGRRYRLDAETFHGAGGAWEPEAMRDALEP